MDLQYEQNIKTEEIVPEYYSKFYLIRKLFFDRIYTSIKLAKLNEEMTILDIGMGSGQLLKNLNKTNLRLCLNGTDFNLNLKKNDGYTSSISDAKKLPYKDSSFNIVFALDVLEHIKDVNVAINEIHRVLKPNGLFIISAPTENILQKFLRFILSGTFSRIENKGSGVHYYNSESLKKNISLKLLFQKEVGLPKYSPIPILKVMKFYKC